FHVVVKHISKSRAQLMPPLRHARDKAIGIIQKTPLSEDTQSLADIVVGQHQASIPSDIAGFTAAARHECLAQQRYIRARRPDDGALEHVELASIGCRESRDPPGINQFWPLVFVLFILNI